MTMQKGMGFSPCNGSTRPQLLARRDSPAGSYLLHDDEDIHGQMPLQSERNANLIIEVLRSLVKEKAFELHDFVIMPDHVHLLLTIHANTTVEKAMQLIKGRFSYRLSHEFDHKGEVWQRGFSEVQVLGKQSFKQHQAYIAENPVEARMVREGEEYPFCSRTLANRKVAGAKARN